MESYKPVMSLRDLFGLKFLVTSDGSQIYIMRERPKPMFFRAVGAQENSDGYYYSLSSIEKDFLLVEVGYYDSEDTESVSEIKKIPIAPLVLVYEMGKKHMFLTDNTNDSVVVHVDFKNRKKVA